MRELPLNDRRRRVAEELQATYQAYGVRGKPWIRALPGAAEVSPFYVVDRRLPIEANRVAGPFDTRGAAEHWIWCMMAINADVPPATTSELYARRRDVLQVVEDALGPDTTIRAALAVLDGEYASWCADQNEISSKTDEEGAGPTSGARAAAKGKPAK